MKMEMCERQTMQSKSQFAVMHQIACSGQKHVCFFSPQLQYPVYWDLLEFCDGFRKLLDHLHLDKVSPG